MLKLRNSSILMLKTFYIDPTKPLDQIKIYFQEGNREDLSNTIGRLNIGSNEIK